MSAIQDLIQSAWVENERALHKRQSDEENAKARMAAKAQADAAWARAHETMRPCSEIHPFARFALGAAMWIVWAYGLGIPLSIIGRIFADWLCVALGGFGFVASFFVTWFTPEVFHYVSEKIRLSNQRKESLAEYEHYQRLANETGSGSKS